MVLESIALLALLGMVSVFKENRLRKHVKSVFALKTFRPFPTQTKEKDDKIILSVCIRKGQPVSFIAFHGNKGKKFIFILTVFFVNTLYFSLYVSLENTK